MSTSLDYDVVVIGAGPAGSAAAIHLARRGYAVLLVEKQSFPREKICGDVLTPRSLAKLDSLGISAVPGMTEVRGIRVFEHVRRSERTFLFRRRGSEPDHGAVVSRASVDHLLATVAVERGAELWTGAEALSFGFDRNGRPVRVCVRRGEDEIQVAAGFFVVAEGSVGRLASLLHRRPSGRTDIELTVRQYFEGSFRVEPLLDVHLPVQDEGSAVPGFAWVFPAGPRLLNVGAILMHGEERPGPRRVRHLYDRFLETLQREDVRFRSGSAQPCGPLQSAALRVGLEPLETIGPGIVAVGDAAGLVNPFDGEGVCYALESGELAAEAIDDALKRDRPEASLYPELLRERYRRHTRLAAELPKLFGLLRVQDWQPPKPRGGAAGIVSPCLNHLIWDSEHAPSSALRDAIWGGMLDHPGLCERHSLIEARIIDSAGGISPMIGELGFYTRRGLLGMPGYLSTLILLVGSLRGRIDEGGVSIAIAGELVMMSALFHDDVGGDPGSVVLAEARPLDAIAILVGDATSVEILAVLDSLDPEVSARLSHVIARDAGRRLERRLSPRVRMADPFSIGDAGDGRARFVGELVGIAASAQGHEPAVAEALRVYADILSRSLFQLVDLWVDLRGHELDRDAASFYLALRGHFGEHVAEARRRGVDLQGLVGGPSALTELEADLLRTRLVESGCVAQVLDVARANAKAAEKALDALPAGLDRAGLRKLVQNVQRAIRFMENDRRWRDPRAGQPYGPDPGLGLGGS